MCISWSPLSPDLFCFEFGLLIYYSKLWPKGRKAEENCQKNDDDPCELWTWR